MKNPRIFGQPVLLFLGSVLCAVGMWLYAQRVLIPYQVADAAASGQPRGNLSDLSPVWIGAQELLLHGKDPYGPEVKRETQAGFYGRPLDASRPSDPKDQKGFVYPVYVAFYLAPTLQLPFEAVRRGFLLFLLSLTCASVPLWLRILHWFDSPWIRATAIVLTLGSLPLMQGLKLQQMSVLVAAMLAIALALLVNDRAVPAGIVLALATIKPQLAWPLLIWLGLWTLADWRRRYRWAAAFLITMAVLFASSEWYLPHWIPRFLQAIREYRIYTDAAPVLENLIPSPWSFMLELLVGLATVLVCWRRRDLPASAEGFACTTCLVLAVTALVVPTGSTYNQVLLIPAVLMLVRERHSIWKESLARRLLLLIAGVLAAWPWFASIVLTALTFGTALPPTSKFCLAPFWTVLFLPSAVVTLALVHLYRQSFAHSPRRLQA